VTGELLHDSLRTSAEAAPDKDAVVDEYGRRTHSELFDDAFRFARALQDEGLHRGDRVVLYLDNTAACSAAIFGVLMAGGVFTVVNSQTKAAKLAYVLDDSEASILVTEAHSADVAAAAVAKANASTVQRVYGVGDDLPAAFAGFRETIESTAGKPIDPGTAPSDLATLVYTSGTTGRPKGVMLSHESLVFTIGSIAEYLRLEPGDRILSVLPMAFTYGLSQLLLTARLGATLLLERSFTFPAKTLKRMRDEKATVFPAVPTVYVTIAGMSHEAPYASVRCLTNAAADLPPAFHERLRVVFPEAALYRMYGLTECVRVCYLEPALVEQKPTSVGKAIPRTEALVLDERAQPVKAGEVGVLHARGPHVMMGYWRAPELTAHMLRESPGGRMLCTHDHFTVDEDGDLYFVDRSDDIIKTRGEKVSTVEVEGALHDIPGVRQAAVVGVPDELLGQAVRAYVVLEEGAVMGEQELIRACRARIENFMVPREVVLVSELPLTESGKVRKRDLTEQT
jgi:acyl-CoA synthetase (AMP-forming)/AMP-acid ligase II